MEKQFVMDKDVCVGENVIIGEQVKIGKNVIIGANSIIENGTIIGDNVKIGHLCVIGADPNVSSNGKNAYGKIIISNGCEIKSNAVICKAYKAEESTQIKENTFIGYGVYVAHNCKINNGVVISPHTCVGGNVSIGAKSNIGSNSFIHQGLCIGEYCMIGAQTKVVRDVPHFTLVSGEHGLIKGINRIGMERNGFSHEQIYSVSQIYDSLYDDFCEGGKIDVNTDIVLWNKIREFMETSLNGCTRRRL